MHYYKRNIGDYHKKAGRLTMLQHGAYTLLMDSIYDRETFPTMDDAIDWVWASNPDEVAAVEFVLKKFFILDGDVYIQNRIEEVIQEYTGTCQANAINGKKGGRPKGSKNKTKESEPDNIKTHSVNLESELNPSESESKPNHKPLTTNQEPETINQSSIGDPPKKEARPKINYDSWPSLPAKQLLNDWLEVRKAKRAKLTQTAINGVGKQLHLAVAAGYPVDQCFTVAVERSWSGFQFKWLGNAEIQPEQAQQVSKFDTLDYGDGIQDL